jgi:hypothetical protein
LLEKLARDIKPKSPIASKKSALTGNAFIKFVAIPKVVQSTYSMEPIRKVKLKESECCKTEELPRISQEHNFVRKTTAAPNKLKSPAFFKSSDTFNTDIYSIERKGTSNSFKKSRQPTSNKKYLSMIEIAGDNVFPTDNTISHFRPKEPIKKAIPNKFSKTN